MKTWGGMDVEVRSFSTLALGGYGQLYARVRFIPGQRADVIHCTGGCVCPTAGLDYLVKRKIYSPLRRSNPESSRPQTSHYIDYQHVKIFKTVSGVNLNRYSFMRCQHMNGSIHLFW
jgi:hypothetical protein